MLAYGPSEAPLTSPIQSRERSRSLYHRRRVLHTSSGPPLLSSCGTDRAVRKHRHMVAKRKDTEVVSQCHVGRGAYPVDCHHLARRLDDDQVLELEDMFDQDTCRLSWGARDRRSVHRWEDQASPRRIGAFVYTVGLRAAPRGRDSVHRWEDQGSLRSIWGVCVHCWAAGLGCGWPWDRNSVHKWEDRASPRRIGAFVYTVGLWRRCGQARGSQECTQIDQNGLSVPFRGICVHCCDAKVARVVTRAASGGMSTPTTMTCRRYPLVAASPLVGKTGSARQALREWRHRQVGVFPKRQPT